MMVTRGLLGLVALSMIASGQTMAADASLPNLAEGDFVMDSFHFQDGESLEKLRLHYTTFGTPLRNAAGEIINAAVLLHGTTGTGQNFLAPSFSTALFGPGQPLDAAKWFIVLPDGIGRGGSSKPSDGLRIRFPHYGYTDLVEAEARLVTEGLGLRHIRLLLGTSMGGMMSWVWAERHPGMMDAVMPIASLPTEISGRNMLWRRLISEAIRRDPDWHDGDYTTKPRQFAAYLPIFTIMVESPIRLQETLPTRGAANAFYDTQIAAAERQDPNDYLYWFEASADYNPAPDLERIKARLFAVNFADDELNPAELGMLDTAVARIGGARGVTIPAGPLTHGHQTLTQAAVWQPYLIELLSSLPPRPE
jgi:homoserine O-acetyltransferase